MNSKRLEHLMNSAPQRVILKGGILKTGQTTQYEPGDDGDKEKGLARSLTILTLGRYAGTVNIVLNAKTDIHSNNCVLDNKTGLMWSRNLSASVGPAADGKLPFTANGAGEGIFTYAAAANAILLAGYSDWRIPNIFELMSISDLEAPSALPDAVAFPGFVAALIISSTTAPATILNALAYNFNAATISASTAKTVANQCILVRGG